MLFNEVYLRNPLNADSAMLWRCCFPELLVVVSPDDLISDPVVLGSLLVHVHCFHLNNKDSN